MTRFTDARDAIDAADTPLAPGEFPNLSGHYDRMMARSAVRRTCEIKAAIGYEPPAVPVPQ